jgi:hypothetical protein
VIREADLLFFSTALAHAIGGILLLGYSMEYYFHLRMYPSPGK